MSHMHVENQTMKARNFLLSGLIVAALGIFAAACNENPTDPTDTSATPLAPTSVTASSIDPNTVALKWVAATDTGAITFSISWKSSDGTDSGSVSGIAGSSQTVNGLKASTAYDFSVTAVRGTKKSAAVTVTWAGASRYGKTVSIKLYETSSSSPSGLTLDPSKGGPVPISVANGAAADVQLALYNRATDSTPQYANNFDIGSAFAFAGLRRVDAFDQNVFISDEGYAALSLDSWYSDGPLSGHIPSDGNVRAFQVPNNQATNGQGFYVRTGTAGDYHYARVFIKNNGGKLLQGTAPNRYIEVEISYQSSANVAFAKGVRPTPANMRSHIAH